MTTIADQVMTAAAPHTMHLQGETITYHGTGSLNREITAVVRYPDDHPTDDVERFRNSQIEITVSNDAATGISAAEFSRQDTVTVPPRSGGAAVVKRLVRITRQNAAFVTYEVN